MTWAELEEFRGWQAGFNGGPFDPHQTADWLRGYALGLGERRQKEAA